MTKGHRESFTFYLSVNIHCVTEMYSCFTKRHHFILCLQHIFSIVKDNSVISSIYIPVLLSFQFVYLVYLQRFYTLLTLF